MLPVKPTPPVQPVPSMQPIRPVRPTATDPGVPWKIIWASIISVAGAGVGIVAIIALHKIITWLLIAAFFAIVLNPAVDFLEHRLHFRRALATLVVLLLGVVVTAAMLYAFIRPIVDQANQFSDKFPTYVADARAGRGTIGRLVKKYNVDTYLEKNKDRISKGFKGAGKPALEIAKSVANGIVALLTILVLSILMLLQAPKMLAGGVNSLPPPRRLRVRSVSADCAKAITGYMAGNLLISVIAAIVTFVSLWAFGVPFKAVLALWVFFADLIPLVGATLGAIPTVGVAFLHSTTAGIGMIIVYVVYQQFENHVLQVTIMARTVKINPLMVLVSVLIGVELFGLLGALLAIPVAGIIQVIGRDLYDERSRRLKPEPTVGSDETPIDEPATPQDATEH